MQRRINVIDMYHGNAVAAPAFAMMKETGLYGIIHKASQGTGYRDPAYAARRKAAQAAGLLWGAYHFLTSADAKQQADFFVKCSGIADSADPILLALDYENSEHTPSLAQAREFIMAVEADSRVPESVSVVIYSGNLIRETLKPHAGGHQDGAMVGVELFFQARRLWLAEYGPKEKIPFPWDRPIAKSSNEATPLPAPGVWLWQFTETGHVNPLIGKTDGNFFDGTFEELQARWLA
jgi:lysozyme